MTEGIILFVMLLILTIQDIKKKCVALWELILMLLIALASFGWNILRDIGFNDIKSAGAGVAFALFITVFCTTIGLLGAADGISLIILSIMTGFRKTMAIFLLALFMASIVAIILLALKKMKPKDEMPFIPFMFTVYAGLGAIQIFI